MIGGGTPLVALSDGYEGVTHAGIALVATESGRVLLTQRALDPTDAPDVVETWEFPGGGLNLGESPLEGAAREFSEETGLGFPNEYEVMDGWRSDDGVYQGFVVNTVQQFDLSEFDPNEEVQAIAWVGRDDLPKYTLRPEVEMQTDWSLIFGPVSGNEDDMTDTVTEIEPEYDAAAFAVGPIPVHGVVAPEDVATGDGRGFNAGSMSRRPMRLPFSDQHVSIGGHDGSVVTGSVDRMMRKDGLIHWEGALMPSEETDRLVARMQFFDGRYGVSVDGDNGSLDTEKVKATGVMWFDAVRASGLTACAIPAFHEAYVAFGHHPEMPEDDTDAVLAASGIGTDDIVGARVTFNRGPGWVTNPEDTRRIHDYWTKKGQPGYVKIGWGTDGDFTRAKALIGAKIAANSPDKMRFLNQIIAQWHFDALGYWPGDLGKPGNPPDTAENRRRAAIHAALSRVDNEGIVATDDGWETVMVASGGKITLPPLSYFHKPDFEFGALVIEDPDEFGISRTYGYAGEWGVCHIGMDGRCVEVPRTGSDDYPEFHLGRTRTDDGYISTGVLTYGVGHRDAETILSESAEQAFFDNIENAWAAVRVGEDERGVWFSGYVLPGVPEEHIVKIEASGQVSGEWKYGQMRACLTVNVPGYAVHRSSAEYDDNGNVVALAASAFGTVDNGTKGSACDPEPTPDERIAALAAIDAEVRMDRARAVWATLEGEPV